MPHIGDVDDVPDLETFPDQRPLQGVGEDIRSHVANVLVGVDGRAAGVQADPAGTAGRGGLGGMEIGDLAGQCVEQP